MWSQRAVFEQSAEGLGWIWPPRDVSLQEDEGDVSLQDNDSGHLLAKFYPSCK